MGLDPLAKIFSGLARQLQRASTTDEAMGLITDAAVILIPGAKAASISVSRRHRSVVSVAATAEEATFFDYLQGAAHQGPCWDALFEHQTMRADDLGTDERWPVLASVMHTMGMRSAVSFQLFVEDETLGSLNVLASTPRAFGHASEHVGLLLSSHAAVALADERNKAAAMASVEDRVVVARAAGIIMERRKVSLEEATAILDQRADDTGEPLTAAAHALVDETAPDGPASNG